MKLDLAQAYIDMGDIDKALSVLESVLVDGDLAQQKEAKKLIDSLQVTWVYILRIAIGIEYDGSNFFGWQAQKKGRSVQSILEHSISIVSNSQIKIYGSGRTDSGVHSIVYL